MDCSALNYDLFVNVHVIENPACPCGHPTETAKHFLLDCNRYITQQQDLISDLNTVNCQNDRNYILFGNLELSIETNKIIFKRYIKFTAK